MGRGLIAQCQKEFIDLRAICDINPKRRRVAAEAMAKAGWPQPKEYEDWREMLQKEDLEATIIATPLWSHAEIAVGCLDAGKHVLCEKMMAKTEAECLRDRRQPTEPSHVGDRLSALLRLSGRLQQHRQAGVARRRLFRAAGLAPQLQLEAQGRPALGRFRSEPVGLSRLGTPVELAALQAIFRRAVRA